MGLETPTSRLAAAEIAIYTVFFLLGIFCFIKHGRPGRLGWLLFLAFCILRLTANGLSINSTSETGGIINSVGISALILTTLGMTHEGSTYTLSYRRNVEWVVVIFLHIAISTGIILVAIGASHLGEDSRTLPVNADDIMKDQGLQKGGYLILLAGLILETLYVVATYRKLPSAKQAGARQAAPVLAKSLVLSVLLSLIFLYVRVIYGVVYAFNSDNTDLSPFNGLFVVKLVPVSLVQIFASIIILIGGIMTRNIGSASVREHERKISHTSY